MLLLLLLSGHIGDPAISSAVDLSAGVSGLFTQLVTLDASLAVANDVTALSLALAPYDSNCIGASGTPAATNVILGLYVQTGTDPSTSSPILTRVATTANIPVSALLTLSGTTVTAPVTVPYNIPAGGGTYFVGFAVSNVDVCILADFDLAFPNPDFDEYQYTGVEPLPPSFVSDDSNVDVQAGVIVCSTADVVGDPIFRGSHGQRFSVKGEADRVFNLLSAPQFSFNNRFVQLDSANQSITASQQRAVRAAYKHSKLLDLVDGSKHSAAVDVARPPVTVAWGHPGTYMGECGLRLGASKLYVQPGSYSTGFATVTLDGVAVPIAEQPIQLEDGMTVTRPSAFKLSIVTADVSFTIVNSDHFINLEQVALVGVDAQVAGLLGQTADNDWEVVRSAEWRQHLENDYKLVSNDLFGADFEGQQF